MVSKQEHINKLLSDLRYLLCSGFFCPTFPEASGDAFFWSSRLATSIFPYFAATWSGVNPFCKRKQEYSSLGHSFSGQTRFVSDLQGCSCFHPPPYIVLSRGSKSADPQLPCGVWRPFPCTIYFKQGTSLFLSSHYQRPKGKPINIRLEFLPCIPSIPRKCMSAHWDVLNIRAWGASMKLCV